jgi:hypothetical protein
VVFAAASAWRLRCGPEEVEERAVEVEVEVEDERVP